MSRRAWGIARVVKIGRVTRHSSSTLCALSYSSRPSSLAGHVRAAFCRQIICYTHKINVGDMHVVWQELVLGVPVPCAIFLAVLFDQSMSLVSATTLTTTRTGQVCCIEMT